jgi:hypothetical protein
MNPSELVKLRAVLTAIVKAEAALVTQTEKPPHAMRGLEHLRTAKSMIKRTLRAHGALADDRAA